MPDSIGREFMRLTRPSAWVPSDQEAGLPQPPLELPYPPGAALIPLPQPKDIQSPPMDLRRAIEDRRTLRSYADIPLTQEELAYLLWTTQGVKRISSRPSTLRTVPSAGARHAFETYLLLNRVNGVAPGLYRYIALQHALLELDLSSHIQEAITRGCNDQSQVPASAATFLWVAVTERMTWRYGERGFRYLLLDAGHVCQNLYLAAESIGCGACAIAAFDDDLLNAALRVDGETLFTIYAASVGKRNPA